MKSVVTSHPTIPFKPSLSTWQNDLKSPHRLIPIKQSRRAMLMCSSSIAYARAEHIYVEIYFGGNRRMLHRDSLATLLETLPEEAFLQVHRSYVVNLKWVNGWRSDAAQNAGAVKWIKEQRFAHIWPRLEHPAPRSEHFCPGAALWRTRSLFWQSITSRHYL